MITNLVNVIQISFYSVFAIFTIVIFVVTYRKKFYNDKLKNTLLTSFGLLFFICGVGILLNSRTWTPKKMNIIGFTMLFISSVVCSLHLLANDIGYRGNISFRTTFIALVILTIANRIIAVGISCFFSKYYIVFIIYDIIVLSRISTIQIKYLINSKRKSLIYSVVGYSLITVGFIFELMILLFDLSLSVNGIVISYTFISILFFEIGLILIQIMIMLQGDGNSRENILHTKH